MQDFTSLGAIDYLYISQVLRFLKALSEFIELSDDKTNMTSFVIFYKISELRKDPIKQAKI